MTKQNTLTLFGDFVLLEDIKGDIEDVKKELKDRVLKEADEQGYVTFPETAQRGEVKGVSIYYKVWAIEKDKLVTPTEMGNE